MQIELCTPSVAVHHAQGSPHYSDLCQPPAKRPAYGDADGAAPHIASVDVKLEDVQLEEDLHQPVDLPYQCSTSPLMHRTPHHEVEELSNFQAAA